MMPYNKGDILNLPRSDGGHYIAIVLEIPDIQCDDKVKTYWLLHEDILNAIITDLRLFLMARVCVLIGDDKVWVNLDDLRTLKSRVKNV